MKEKDAISEIRPLSNADAKVLSAFIDHYRFSTLGSLVRGIIHNFNGSLQVLSMQMELLQGMLTKEGYGTSSPLHAKMEQCLEQLSRLKAMIEILFKKGSREGDEPQLIDLNELLEEQLSLLQHHLFFKHQVKVNKAFQPDLPSLNGIHGNFSEGLLSLVSNAIEAMEGSPRKELTLKTETEDGFIRVRIGDTGCGIFPEIRPYLFNPFFTTKGGSHFGLGLFISKELLTPYGATFAYASKKGETIFSVSFPFQGPPAPRPKAK